MTIKIGRVGLDVALTSPRDWKQGGDAITLGGTYDGGTVEQALVLRRQLSGLRGNDDEAVIPVIWTPDSDAQGYYKVRGVDVDTHGPSLATGKFTWVIALERVQGYTSPLFESVVAGALLQNAHGIVSGTAIPFHAVPAIATEYRYGTGGFYSTRPSAEGDIQWFTNGNYTATPRFYLPPDHFYDGSAVLSTNLSSPKVVVGRQIPQDPYSWVISNGLTQITPAAPGPTGKFNVSHYETGAYQPAKRYIVKGETTAGDITEFLHITVLRNSPEEVAIQLSCRTNYGINWGIVTLDISLRRGDRLARFFLQSDAQSDWSVRRDGVEGESALTGGVRALVDDAQGNRYVIATSSAFTDDGQGKVKQSGGATHNTFDFGIGSEIGGTGAAGYDAAQSVLYQYFAAQNERMTVVGR